MVTAMPGVRVLAWRWGEPLGERRRQPGPLCPACTLALITPDGALCRADWTNSVGRSGVWTVKGKRLYNGSLGELAGRSPKEG